MRISQPVSVTSRVCSNWADRFPSLVTAVQPSGHVSSCQPPETLRTDAHSFGLHTSNQTTHARSDTDSLDTGELKGPVKDFLKKFMALNPTPEEQLRTST